MKKQLLTAALAGLLSVSTIMTAFAAGAGPSGGGVRPASDGTDVYAGIILNDPNAKISVKVPTLFAFVVNGDVASGSAVAVTMADGTVMVPNVKVKVNTPGSANSDYQIETVGTGIMRFENLSTKAADATTAATGEIRVGIPVNITGSIKNDLSASERKNWIHVGNAESLQNDSAGFKKYTLAVRKVGAAAMIPFSVSNSEGGFQMGESIPLNAPDLGWTGSAFTNMNDDTKLANAGNITELDFGVYVGGKRNQYTQVEESARVGSIVWTVGHTIANDGTINTSPSGAPLS